MKLEQSFEVTAPLQRVWEALIDVERVAPCLPGAAITGRNDDGSYNGEFKVKIGPTSASYSGKLNMESVDESAHQATMDAAGTDKRGQGGAKATIQSSVEKVDAGTTKVNVLTDYHITGRLARFGRGGMIEEISNRLLREFASNLQEMLAGDGEDAADTAETAIVEDSTGATAGSSATAGGEYADAGAAGADAAGAVDASAAAGTGGAEQAEVASEDGEGAGDGDGAAESGASPAETTAAAQEPPVPQAGSQGEPGDPAHATEATDESDVSSGRANAPADDPFAPPVPPPPPSGVAAGSAPPPPETPPRPPDNEPVQGLSLVGGALVGQVKSNPAPFVGALVAILIALGLLRRRGRG
jgi:carbon monoxide dehydrogenase subunit G